MTFQTPSKLVPLRFDWVVLVQEFTMERQELGWPMQTTQEQILQRLKFLPETMLQEVLLFIDFLISRLKPTVKPAILDLAGTLPAPDAAQMQQALEDCSQVDPDEW